MPLGCRFPVLGFVGPRNVGKTTLLTALLPILLERGVRPAVIKQARRSFEIDHLGTDSRRLRDAGAVQTLIASSDRWALIVETPDGAECPDPEQLVRHLDPRGIDLVLLEGFPDAAVPKVEVHRAGLGVPLRLSHDPHIVALATDRPALSQLPYPMLNLNAPLEVAGFVLARYRHFHSARYPGRS